MFIRRNVPHRRAGRRQRAVARCRAPVGRSPARQSPIAPTRLQLGRGVGRADPAGHRGRAGEGEPACAPNSVRIVESDVPTTIRLEPAKPAATADDDAGAPAVCRAPCAPVARRAHALCGAEPLCAAAWNRPRHRPSICGALGDPTRPCPRCRCVPQALAAWRLEPVGDGREAHQHFRCAGSTWTTRIAGRLPRRDLPAQPGARPDAADIVYLVTRGHGLAGRCCPSHRSTRR